MNLEEGSICISDLKFLLVMQLLTASSAFFVLQLHVPLFNSLIPVKLNLYKPLNNAACHRIYIEEFSPSSDTCNFKFVSMLNLKSA